MIKNNSVWTFGFEVEAILDPERNNITTGHDIFSIHDTDIIENHFSDRRDVFVPDEAKETILYLKDNFGGKAVTDSSIKSSDPSHFPFEYVSSPEELSLDVLERLKDILIHIKKNGVYANESCGFHFHFSYEGITKFELIWIKIFYLFDNRSEKFSSFLSSAGEIGLWSDQYANQGNLKARRADFQQIVDSMNNPETAEFKKLLNDFFGQPYFSSKYTVFGIHDKYRTLEWRGPRGFLSTNDDQDITKFIDLLRDFAEWLSFARHQNTIKVGDFKLKRETFRKIFSQYAQPHFIDFGIDISNAVDAATTDEERVSAMIEFFRHIDLESRHSTNFRKISNKIKANHPKAWALMCERLNS